MQYVYNFINKFDILLFEKDIFEIYSKKIKSWKIVKKKEKKRIVNQETFIIEILIIVNIFAQMAKILHFFIIA